MIPSRLTNGIAGAMGELFAATCRVSAMLTAKKVRLISRFQKSTAVSSRSGLASRLATSLCRCPPTRNALRSSRERKNRAVSLDEKNPLARTSVAIARIAGNQLGASDTLLRSVVFYQVVQFGQPSCRSAAVTGRASECDVEGADGRDEHGERGESVDGHDGDADAEASFTQELGDAVKGHERQPAGCESECW